MTLHNLVHDCSDGQKNVPKSLSEDASRKWPLRTRWKWFSSAVEDYRVLPVTASLSSYYIELLIELYAFLLPVRRRLQVNDGSAVISKTHAWKVLRSALVNSTAVSRKLRWQTVRNV